jgi:hypothetical protein
VCIEAWKNTRSTFRILKSGVAEHETGNTIKILKGMVRGKLFL